MDTIDVMMAKVKRIPDDAFTVDEFIARCNADGRTINKQGALRLLNKEVEAGRLVKERVTADSVGKNVYWSAGDD